MVLENLFPENYVENKMFYAFLLGFMYSLLSVIIAKYTFSSNSGIVSVIFLSIFLTPSLRKMFVREEKVEEHERKFSLKHMYKDNKHLIKAYVGVFFGIFFAYFIITFVLPLMGFNTLNIIKEQLFLDPAISGRATYDVGLFGSIISSNWIVLLVTFLLALAAGDGAIFFVAWNASAWGAIFGFRAFAASQVLNRNPFVVAFIMLSIVMWHIIIEGGAYILAAISGSVISDEVIKKSKEIKKFLGMGVPIFFMIFIIKFMFDRMYISPLFRTFAFMIFVIGLIHLWGRTFSKRSFKEVFIYNYWLFIIAIIVFILGGLVETAVLSYSAVLNDFYSASMMFFGMI